MKINRSCEIKPLNWGALPELKNRLAHLGVKVESVSIEIWDYPDSFTYDSFDEAYREAQVHDSPEYYTMNVFGKKDKNAFSLHINRMINLGGDEILSVTLNGSVNIDDMNKITDYLGLVPGKPVQPSPKQPRTAFIAHRFDELGTKCADKLARFLELLGFSVVTGRAYAPKSVSEKVRHRIEEQAILFAIFSAGTDDTWLTQESIIGNVKGKPLIFIRDKQAEYKGGILADHEYIPFLSPNIEKTFIQILEGLRELDYLNF